MLELSPCPLSPLSRYDLNVFKLYPPKLCVGSYNQENSDFVGSPLEVLFVSSDKNFRVVRGSQLLPFIILKYSQSTECISVFFLLCIGCEMEICIHHQVLITWY